MGSACCVAAREKPVQSRPSNDTFHRNIRCSPTWSFRWENRGRVAGEETSLSWSSAGVPRSEGFIRYHSASGSEEGSPSESFQRQTWKKSISQEGSPLEDIQSHTWQKTSVSSGTTGLVGTPTSGIMFIDACHLAYDFSNYQNICFFSLLQLHITSFSSWYDTVNMLGCLSKLSDCFY